MGYISWTRTRDITEQEVESMITGTGALAWSWWSELEKTDDGWNLTGWDGESEGGNVTYEITVEKVAEAVTELLQSEHLDPTDSDVNYAINEDLGYLDAAQADMCLQWVAFGDIVYG